jgi:hypothetical protein
VDRHREVISGGERVLYEVAVAAASLGCDVELRGWIDETILDLISGAVGHRPQTGLPPRRPQPGEIVVVPEAAELDLLAGLHLSPARPVLFVLAPPGLFGWSFLPGWSPPDPLTVTPQSVGLPESYRAAADLGFSVWTNSHGDAADAARGGVAASYVGSGFALDTDLDLPGPTHDVAVVKANRWYPLAAEVVDRLPGVSVYEVPDVRSVYGLQRELAHARVLAFPTRVEGASRICREARMAGTVPVVLDSNVHVTSDDWGEGVVLAHDLTQLASEIRALLADRARLEDLSRRARSDARRQGDWSTFVRQVDAALRAVPDDAGPGLSARAELGDHSARRWSELEEERDTWNQVAAERLCLVRILEGRSGPAGT